MHGEPVSAIFQRIILGDGLARQFAVLADQQQSGIELHRQRPADDEAACLDRRDQVDRSGHAIRKRVDRTGQADAVEQQRRDVAIQDSGLGKVRYGADQRLQLVGTGHVPNP